MPPRGIPRKYVAPHEFNGDELGITLSELKSRHPRLTEIRGAHRGRVARAGPQRGFCRLPADSTKVAVVVSSPSSAPMLKVAGRSCSRSILWRPRMRATRLPICSTIPVVCWLR